MAMIAIAEAPVKPKLERKAGSVDAEAAYPERGFRQKLCRKLL